MKNYEVVKSGNFNRNNNETNNTNISNTVNNFAVKLFNSFSKNTIIPFNKRTSIAIAASVMHYDFTENNKKLMESGNINSELNSIILALSKLNETSNIITLMNESTNMYDCIKIFSSKFYGEIYPEKTVSRKMCFVNKIESLIGGKKM